MCFCNRLHFACPRYLLLCLQLLWACVVEGACRHVPCVCQLLLSHCMLSGSDSASPLLPSACTCFLLLCVQLCVCACACVHACIHRCDTSCLAVLLLFHYASLYARYRDSDH